MKRLWIGLSLLAAICSFVAFAAEHVMATQPVGVVLKALKSQGYVTIRKIQLVNDSYWVHALNEQGEPVDLQINSHNGEIITMKKTDLHISMEEVVTKIEAVGYTGISFIQAQNNHYDVIAIGPNGKRTQLQVDAATGAITKSSAPFP
jgi:uncharacterized membrane protein YkoI